MAPSTNLYAALAGNVGRPDQIGRIGVFRRDAVGGEWQHVLPDLEAFTVIVHPCQPTLVLAGTADGVWRSEDRGATFARGFPGQGQADLVVPRRREQSGSRLRGWLAGRRLPQRERRQELAATTRSSHRRAREGAFRRPRHACDVAAGCL